MISMTGLRATTGTGSIPAICGLHTVYMVLLPVCTIDLSILYAGLLYTGLGY